MYQKHRQSILEQYYLFFDIFNIIFFISQKFYHFDITNEKLGFECYFLIE